jgi:cytochrome c5
VRSISHLAKLVPLEACGDDGIFDINGVRNQWGASDSFLRIAQGNEVMVKHAIEVFKGDTGCMPPKSWKGSELKI